jgi:hypothetical protein
MASDRRAAGSALTYLISVPLLLSSEIFRVRTLALELQQPTFGSPYKRILPAALK